jgi:hypothetical protein
MKEFLDERNNETNHCCGKSNDLIKIGFRISPESKFIEEFKPLIKTFGLEESHYLIMDVDTS